MTADQRNKGSQGQGQFKLSGLGWLCVFYHGKWVPVFRLTQKQLDTFSSWKELGIKS